MNDPSSEVAAAATPEPRVKKKMMYLHRTQGGRETKDDCWKWVFVPDDWEAGDEIPGLTEWVQGFAVDEDAFKSWLINEAVTVNPQPGQVFVFEFTPDLKNIFFRTREKKEYVGWHNDVKLAAYCHARNRRFEAQAKQGKEGKMSDALKCLEPLKELYATLPSPLKAQLIAMIVHHVSGY